MTWIECDCSVGQKCPQGKRGHEQKCQIWKKDPLADSRQYLPTLADLIDRRSIVLLKEIFIPDHRDEYRAEGALIDHDIDMILRSTPAFLSAKELRAIIIIMLSNRFIWENESKARAGGDEQDKLLKLTHSINGVRNRAKNIVAAFEEGRLDYKLDCLASELPREYGNWNIFGEDKKS
jgi:hypothetical protein